MVTTSTYLEYINESKNAFRFYEVTVQDKKVIIRYGRIDTKGKEKELSFISNSEAFHQANAKIDEKILKGYKVIDKKKGQEISPDYKLNICHLENTDEAIFTHLFSINFPTPQHVNFVEILRNSLLYISPLWRDLSSSLEPKIVLEKVCFHCADRTEFSSMSNENIESLKNRLRHIPSNYWLKYLCDIDIVFNTNGAIPEYFGLIVVSNTNSKQNVLLKAQKLIDLSIPLSIGIQNIFVVSVNISSKRLAPMSWSVLTDLEKWEITKKLSTFILSFQQVQNLLIQTLEITI